MGDVISLLDADPDLADLLDERELPPARRKTMTRVQRLSPGDWDAAAAHEPAEHRDPDRTCAPRSAGACSSRPGSPCSTMTSCAAW
jgi:hypothetical protein